MNHDTHHFVKIELLTQANSSHAHLAQYANYWDNYSVVRVVRDIPDRHDRGQKLATKGQLMLGEIVTNRRVLETLVPGVSYANIFVPNRYENGCNCIVEAKYIEVVVPGNSIGVHADTCAHPSTQTEYNGGRHPYLNVACLDCGDQWETEA